jgi:hypothetical protein
MRKKITSLQPSMNINRVGSVVAFEYTCNQIASYKLSVYLFNDGKDRAKQFEEELKWVASIVKGSNFSCFTKSDEVIIYHSDQTSISIATGSAACEFIQHYQQERITY